MTGRFADRMLDQAGFSKRSLLQSVRDLAVPGVRPSYRTVTDIGPLEIEVCTALDNSPIAQDQRGIQRPQRNTCDIGAFEAEPVRVYLPLINK